jgi:hypothetical protein
MTVSLGDIVASLQMSLVRMNEASDSVTAARSGAETLLMATSAMELDDLSARLNELIGQLDHLTGKVGQVRTVVTELIDLTMATEASITTASTVQRPLPSSPGPERSGSLGAAFKAGVQDFGAILTPKERMIADYLAARGANVQAISPDHTVFRQSNPDTIVRRSAADPGTVTEFKTLERPTSSAVKRCILTAGGQLTGSGGGHVVIDGRAVNLDESTAREGRARAVGEARAHRKSAPAGIFVILPGDVWLDLSQEGSS